MHNNNPLIPQEKISDFCRKWKVLESGLFGSILREDFHTDSDIDVLVTFAPDAHHSLFDLVRMEEELAAIFGRRVDLVERAALRNPFRRQAILKSLEIIYAA